MLNAKPFISKLQTVESQWTDYNGHLNMAYYAVIFDRAAEELFEGMGLGADYVKRTNCTTFTLETHTTYLAEMKEGEQARVETRIIAADQKRVHYVQQMFRGHEDYLACVMEVIVSHVDLTAHKTSPYPAEIQAKIDAVAKAHATLPMPPQVGHRIGLPTKK